MESGVVREVHPLGDRGLIVVFAGPDDRRLRACVRGAVEALRRAALPGLDDVVPTFESVALHFRGGFEPLRARVDALLSEAAVAEPVTPRVVEIPVCYGGPFGPDLVAIAMANGLTIDEAVARHEASPHVVDMIGFAPGFPYLSGLDPRLRVPRRATPRTTVPAGSVGIANAQSVVYPIATPGGWNLIGRTPLRLFDPADEPPCLLAVGDDVRFVRVSLDRYAELEAAA